MYLVKLYFLLQHRADETQPGRNSCARLQFLAFSPEGGRGAFSLNSIASLSRFAKKTAKKHSS